jgi:hypothetical protein
LYSYSEDNTTLEGLVAETNVGTPWKGWTCRFTSMSERMIHENKDRNALKCFETVAA